MNKRSDKLIISRIEVVGVEYVATATNGIDVYHAAAKTKEMAEQRAINGLKSVLMM